MLKIITTSDGSHSILNEELQETYHSVHGAMQESLHVFIHHGLAHIIDTSQSISILEIGFGTGLNALLTFQYAQSLPKNILYTSIEPSPLSEEIWSVLNYAESLDLEKPYVTLHRSKWNAMDSLRPNFNLLKLHVTLQDATLVSGSYDLVYYDAFAPSKQPELWDLLILEKVHDAMKPGGILVTYCAKGEFKRNLRELGLKVETLPGPPGKKEMVRAQKNNII